MTQAARPERLIFRRTYLYLPPAFALAAYLIVALTHLSDGLAGVLLILVLALCLTCLPAALTSHVVVYGDLLSARGVPPYRGYNPRAKAVQLSRLTAVYPISFTRYGREALGGRSMLALEDAMGARQRVPMTFLVRGGTLKTLIAQGIARSGAQVPAATMAILGDGGLSPADQPRVLSRRVTSVRFRGPGRR